VEFPRDLKYTSEHEWAALEDAGRVRVGITDFAQDALGDVVYVDLPEEGSEVRAGDAFGEVESTKSVSDLFSPVSGRVVERNAALGDAPELVNQDPYGEGWIILVEMSDPSDVDDLMDAEAYRHLIQDAGEAS
jgi:glycine cleavage system H protein